MAASKACYLTNLRILKLKLFWATRFIYGYGQALRLWIPMGACTNSCSGTNPYLPTQAVFKCLDLRVCVKLPKKGSHFLHRLTATACFLLPKNPCVFSAR